MFNKQYYKLDEAANELGADMLSLSYAIDYHNNQTDTEKWSDFIYLYAIIDREKGEALGFNYGYGCNNGIALEILKSETKSLILELSLGNTLANLRIKTQIDYDDCGDVIGFAARLTEIDIGYIYLDYDGFCKLKALKAQQDGKPTLEQLQAENEALKKQLDELNNSTSQTILQQREQALLFWVEGLGRDTVKAMSKPQIHEALKKIDRIFHFSDFDKFWQKQQVIKLEAGAPTR